MLKQETKKKGSFRMLLAIAALLLFLILLENISSYLPGVPAILQPTSQLFTVLKKGAVYSLVAVSMNLLNGFTGLFSLGQAGFMLLGAYTFAIFNVPMAAKDQVYYLYGGSAVKYSLMDLFQSLFGSTGAGGAVAMVCAVLVGLLLAGLVACCVVYTVAGVLVTGPYTMGEEGYLRRIVTLEPGDYTLSGDWEGEISLSVQTRSKAEILMGEKTPAYQGSMEDAAFTIPEGTEQVELWFRGPEGVRLEEVTLSDGTGVPLKYPLLPAFIADRIQGSLFSDSSFLLRAQYMKDAWTIFTQSPLLGHGLASTEGLFTSVQPFYYESLYVHNHILQVMCDMGLLGLAAFLLLLLGCAWLLVKNLRSEDGPLAAMLLAGWVLMNAHSAMEINFSIRAYQCAALLWLLLPVLLFARPLSRKGLVKWGGLAVSLLLWLYLAVFGFLLERHRMVQRDMAEFSTDSASEFMETTRRFVKQDVFVQEQNKLNFVANAAILQESIYNGEKSRWVNDLRKGGTYTACSGLARYYYLRQGEYEELFACSRQGIAQEASTNEAWNLQLDFYRNEVLPAMAEEHLDLFLEEVLNTRDYLETYSQGRMEEIQLSEENQAFLQAVSAVQEAGLEGEKALLTLSALQDAQS